MKNTVEINNFVELYKTMPELWNAKNEHCKNKNLRNKGYEKLLTEYKIITSDRWLELLSSLLCLVFVLRAKFLTKVH